MQVAPRRFDVAALREQHGDPDLGVQPMLAAPHAPVRGDRVVGPLPGLRDTGEVVVRRIAPRGALRELREVPRRLVEPIRLQEQQPERVADVVVPGVVRHEALEFGAGLLVASRVDEHSRVGHAGDVRLGDALEEFLQHAERPFDVVHAQARARQEDRDPRVAGIEFGGKAEHRRRLVESTGPGEKPGKRELRRRVVLVSCDEPLHHGGRRFPVPLSGKDLASAVEPRTRRIGRHLDDRHEVFDRCVEVPGPDQHGRDRLPGLDARRIDLAPQARRIDRLPIDAREHRDLRRPRRDARIPGLPCGLQVTPDRGRQVTTLAGKLRDQQLVEHVPGESADGRRGGASVVRTGDDRILRLRAGGGAPGEEPRHDRHREPPPPPHGHVREPRRPAHSRDGIATIGGSRRNSVSVPSTIVDRMRFPLYFI